MVRLEVELFNGLAVMDGCDLVDTLNTPRLQALLAYLLLNRGVPQFRYYIANLFWPDSPEDQGRTNLRKLIYLLRQALPDITDYVTMDAHALTWRKDSSYSLDVEEFERLLVVQPGQGIPLENLERAIALYCGDLLPGCYDEWIIPIRQRLYQAYLFALESAAAMHEDRRAYQTALVYALKLVQADPLDEAAALRVMRLYALINERAKAIETYQTLAARLKTEIGVAPAAELRELYQSLQKNPKNPASGVPDPSRNGHLELIGRKTEWQKIHAHWKTAAAGNPHLLLLTGEAGIGKTRLAEELAVWAARQGICTAMAHAYPAEGNLPYAPVIAWLRANPLPDLENVWLTEIARLLPEVLQEHPDLPAPGILAEAWQRQRLFEALSRSILCHCQMRLLVLDDMQWCDRDTLEWLHYLLRQDPHAALLIVGTVRSEEVTSRDHPLAQLQSALAQIGACDEIALGPLSEAETAQLGGQTAGRSLSAAEAAALYHETEGSPLFIVETLRAGLNIDEPLPGKIRRVLEKRLNQLTPATRELVYLAASIGRRFSWDVLQHASGLSDTDLAGCIDELLEKRIAREYASPTNTAMVEIGYDFSHDKLREAAFFGLSTAHRRLLHARVAAALREISAGAPEEYAAEIASHYDRAGMLAQAVEFYRLAGVVSRNIFANQDAIGYFGRALELSEGLGASASAAVLPPQAKIDLLEQYGEVLQLSGRFPEAKKALQQALEAGAGRPEVWQSSLLRQISEIQISLYDHAAALQTLEQAERSLGLDGQTCAAAGQDLSQEQREWIAIQFAKIQWMYWQGRLDEMDRLIGQVQEPVARASDAKLEFDLLGLRFQVELRREGVHLSERTVNIARHKRELQFSAKTPVEACYSEFQYGFALLFNGKPGDACVVLEKALSEAEKLGAMMVVDRLLAYLALTYRRLGDTRGATRVTERLMEVSERIGEHSYEGMAWASRAWLSWKQGEYEAAYRLAQRALEVWTAYASTYAYPLMAPACWLLVDICLRKGRTAEAARYAKVMLNPPQNPPLEPVGALLAQGIAASESGDERQAGELFQKAVQEVQRNGEF